MVVINLHAANPNDNREDKIQSQMGNPLAKPLNAVI